MNLFDWRTPPLVVLQWLVELFNIRADSEARFCLFHLILLQIHLCFSFCLPRIPHVVLSNAPVSSGIIPVCV